MSHENDTHVNVDNFVENGDFLLFYNRYYTFLLILHVEKSNNSIFENEK